ncbi:hypothetical protein ID866_9744 [Astraeus odoratus]|nr:hypothetical protein ID866_9744 [Astraeus odoratus]
MALSYAEEREANIRRNRQVLIGLDFEKLVPQHEPKETPRTRTKRSYTKTTDQYEEPPKKLARVETPPEISSEGRRRSHRLASNTSTREQQRGTLIPLTVKKIVSSASESTTKTRKYDPKVYGSIPGIEVGSWWGTREECSNDSIHAPWVGGIAPGKDGAYSVALSGGYEDDVDNGTYTGAGGRDLKGTKASPKNLRTAEQSFDQSFDHNHNRALKRSVETGNPVRVIRGYKLQSRYGPSEGYRYDGLYEVKKCWTEKGLGKGGHLVCKFAFVRLPGQPDIPVNDTKAAEHATVSDDANDSGDGSTTVTTSWFVSESIGSNSQTNTFSTPVVITLNPTTTSAASGSASGSASATGNTTTTGSTSGNATSTVASSNVPTAATSVAGANGGGPNGGAPSPGASASGGIYGPPDGYIAGAEALRSAVLLGGVGFVVGGMLTFA